MTVNYMEIAKEMLSGCLFIPEEYLQPETQIIAIPGFDSISFMTLLVQIEAFLKKKIDYQPIIQIRTVQDLAHYLAQEKTHEA